MAIPSPQSKEAAKKAAAEKAVSFVADGMCIGLGTGSTAKYFIDALILRCQQGLSVQAVATSEKSHTQAIEGGISMMDPNSFTYLDLVVDGADEIDSKKRMIKGGGGALLREKIIAASSKEMIVIVDEAKCVNQLGGFPLPIEIAPFAYNTTIHHLNDKGYYGSWRMNGDSLFVTDNQHYIYDITFEGLIENPEHHEVVINAIPGVMTTGFFFHLAGRVIVGYENGSTKIY